MENSKTDWGCLYSGKVARDAHMEVSRLTCKTCGGLQDECTCENHPDCKHCTHPGLSHDEEFGNCCHLGITDTGHDICDCPGYEGENTEERHGN